MELRNLITFIHVVELGSFTKAAEALDYSQSTVSFQIKQLEDELDCLLFERINHTITLTERGRELVSYAHNIRALTDSLKENINKEENYSGHVHVVMPDSICEELICSHYVNFYKKYPSISLQITNADTQVMFDMLNRNEADLIMTLDSHVYQKDYVIAKEQTLSMNFVTNADSELVKRECVSIKEIVNEPFVLTEYGQGYRKVLDRELAKRSLEISPALEIGRTDIITEVLSKSNMISFLPDFVTKRKVEAGELAYINVSDVDIAICKQLIYHKNKWISKSLKTVIEYLKQTEFAGA